MYDFPENKDVITDCQWTCTGLDLGIEWPVLGAILRETSLSDQNP